MCGYRSTSLPVQFSASPFWVESDEAAAARLVRLSKLPFVSSFNLTPVALCGSLFNMASDSVALVENDLKQPVLWDLEA
jgi:hypothetical protein